MNRVAVSGSMVDSPSPIFSLTASRDAAKIQEIIAQRYGFVPTLAYCVDLVAFVEGLTDGQ